MSLQIRISYQHDEELRKVTDALAPFGLKLNIAEQKGVYKRAYLKDPNIDAMRHKSRRTALEVNKSKYHID